MVTARFREIEPPERLVYATTVRNALQDPLVEVVSGVTLTAVAGKTRVQLKVDDVGDGPANHQTPALRA